MGSGFQQSGQWIPAEWAGDSNRVGRGFQQNGEWILAEWVVY